MRISKVILPLLAIVGVGVSGWAITACQAHAQVAVNTESSSSASVETPPPPPPSSSPPAATTPPPPPPAPKITLKGVSMKSATQIDMPGKVDFKTGSAKLDMTKDTTSVLTQIQTVLKNNPDITKLRIEGNTDNEGEDKGFDNVKLSQQRAQSVVDWLTKNGIDASRLDARGNGSKNGLFPNDSAEHKAANRRVEFHVEAFQGQPVASDSGGASPTPAATASTTPAASASGAVGGAKPKGK